MKMQVKKVSIDDSNKSITRNKNITMKRMFSNRRFFEKSLDTVTLCGPGGADLVRMAGEQEVQDMFAESITSEFLASRYNLDADATLQDMMDVIPVGAALHVDFDETKEIDNETVAIYNWHIVLVKETEESHELAEFWIPSLKMSGRYF